MRQFNLFGSELRGDTDTKYSNKIKAPTYEPKNKKPHIFELYDNEKTKRLIREIELSDVTDDEKLFLLEAAKRHTVFNYSKIADYYAHTTPVMQQLMERSALVIIDFEKAILNGYVRLSDELRKQYLEEYGE